MIPVYSFLALPVRISFSLLLSIYVSVRGYRKKSLSFSGCFLAFFVGFLVSVTSYTFCICLLTFFLTSSKLTKWRHVKKERIEYGHKAGGQRDWIQVFCNGCLPVTISVLYLIEVGHGERPIDFQKDFTHSVLTMAFIGALSCSNGDTWASEIGTVTGKGNPWHVLMLRRVPRGCNGGISIIGTLASICGGMTIGFIYFGTLYMFMFLSDYHHYYPVQWPIVFISSLCGFIGSMIDSILGATLQFSGYSEESKKIVNKPGPNVKRICGMDLLSNNAVNLLSVAMTAGFSPVFAYGFWQILEAL